MPFVFLLIFALLSFQAAWPEADWLDWDLRLIAPWAMVLGFWLLADRRTTQFCRQVARSPGDHAWLWRRCEHQRRQLTLLLTGCYLAVLYGLGWGYLAKQCAKELGVTMLTELLQFAPTSSRSCSSGGNPIAPSRRHRHGADPGIVHRSLELSRLAGAS